MPAFTARLNLYMPGGGSLNIGGDDEVADIDKLNQNFQKLDEFTNIFRTPIASVPLNPYDGQIIEIAETGEVRYWSDTASRWKQLKPHVGTTPPSFSVGEGDLWVDTN